MQPLQPPPDPELENLEQDEKVIRALNETPADSNQSKLPGLKRSPAPGATALLLLICGLLYALLGWKILPIPVVYIAPARKVLVTIMLISLVLLAIRMLKKYLNRTIANRTTVYNFNRVADLFAGLLILAIVLSLLFANWYAAMVSFGIVSLILGLALQNPLTSFFGWLYILIRKPYEVGDRIRIGNVYGDVINVNYIDTTLWEFRGDYLSGDHPSGRIIRFSNSKVFNEYVYNYSWPLFPFLWNELVLFVAYESNFKFVADTIQQLVQTEVGEAMIRRVARFKKILANTPVDELQVNELPSVMMKAHENTWVEVTVRYLVEPKSAGQVKKRLFEVIMQELQQHPDKVKFPKQPAG